MSVNNVAYQTSVAAAGAAAVIAKATAETVRQGTIAAASSSVGYRPGFPGAYSAYAAACAAASAQKLIDLVAADTTKQAAISNAKDLLRSQGEIPL
jgi:hypothetical protein